MTETQRQKDVRKCQELIKKRRDKINKYLSKKNIYTNQGIFHELMKEYDIYYNDMRGKARE